MAPVMLLAALALGGASCGLKGEPEYLVPAEDTVEGQYAVAEKQEADARGVFDEKLREEEMKKAILAYRAVETRFPNDTKFTPAASLIIGNIHQVNRQFEEALAQYEMVLQKYPNDDQARIGALLGKGQTLDSLDRPEEAQVYYKMLIDQYQGAKDPKFREMVDRATTRYRQIRPRKK